MARRVLHGAPRRCSSVRRRTLATAPAGRYTPEDNAGTATKLLAKALYKLAEPYATSISQDPAVLLRLTGWLPELVPISPTLPGPSTPLQFREQLFREPTRSHALAAPHEFGADLPPDGSPGGADPGVGRLWAKRGVSHVGSNADSAATSAAGSLAGSQYNSPGCGRSA